MTMQPTNVNYEVSAQMGQFYVAVYSVGIAKAAAFLLIKIQDKT